MVSTNRRDHTSTATSSKVGFMEATAAVSGVARMALLRSRAIDELSHGRNQSHGFGVIDDMGIPRRVAGIPGFGLAYSVVLILVAIPTALIYTVMFGYGSRGFAVRITKPPTRVAQQEENCLVVSVRRSNTNVAANQPEVRVNFTSVSWADLRLNLEIELRRRADQIVFVEGDGNLEVSDIVRVIDIARGARPGIPVVLLTPALKRTLSAACVKREP